MSGNRSMSTRNRRREHALVGSGGRRGPRRRGAAVVEFAIAFPVLLMFFVFMWEFSRAEMIRQTAASAAYEGARQAIVAGGSAEDATQMVNAVMQAVGIADSDVTVTPSIITPDTESVQIAITVPMSSNAWISPLFFRNLEIHSNMTLRR